MEEGWALFCDCDVLCWEDIGNLFALADPAYAVMVVKHKQETGDKVKMDGQIQTYYARKNWSSVILYNCAHPAHATLTLPRLNGWPGRDLHAFKWLSDEEIGELPLKWNWLVNVTEGMAVPEGMWHYTLGGPWIKGWEPKPYDAAWRAEKWLQHKQEMVA